MPLFDDRVLSEYGDVLHRPRLGFDHERLRMVLRFIESRGDLAVAAPLPLELPDADDTAFLEVAAAGAAEALITGNERHFVPTSGEHHVTVLAPAAFLDAWRARPNE